MPEFILDHGSPEASKRFANLDSFTQGYVEAMFFTNTGTGDDGDMEHATVSDLSEEAWSNIIRSCEAFQEKAKTLLTLAYARNYDAAQAGRDYWFTRNGHGVGFWDREQLEADSLGDELSDACRHSEVYVCRGDDGLVYHD